MIKEIKPLQVKCKEARKTTHGDKVIKGAVIELKDNEYLVIWKVNDWGLTSSEWVKKAELEEIAHPLHRNKLARWDKPEVVSKIESLAQ
jgi:hypothetical protein